MCTHVHISLRAFITISFCLSSFVFTFLLSSRLKIKKIFNIETEHIAQRSIVFFPLFSLFFFLFLFTSSSPYLSPFPPLIPPIAFPIALQRSGDDVSIHAFALISPPYLVLLAFHPYVEDVPILVVSQPNGSYEILRHRFPPGNRVFSIQGREFNSTILWMPRAFPFPSLSLSFFPSPSSFSEHRGWKVGGIHKFGCKHRAYANKGIPGKSACIRDRA